MHLVRVRACASISKVVGRCEVVTQEERPLNAAQLKGILSASAL